MRPSKAIGIWAWNTIKRIRNLPSWIRAAILLVLYTLATKSIDKFAEVMATMNNLAASNMTAFANYLDTSSKDIWAIVLQVVIILAFVGIASWLWGDGNKKDIQDLKKEMRKGNRQIIKEIRKDRQQGTKK